MCAGDHVARTVSLSDINEIRFGLGNVPIETVTPPALPPCFATADTKKEFLKALKEKIDAIQAEIKKARLEFEIAQDNSNLTVLQIRYEEAEALGLCGHAMRSITGQPTKFELNGSLGTAIATSNFINTGNFSAGSEDMHTPNNTGTRGTDFTAGLGASATLGGASLPSDAPRSTLAWGIDGNFNVFSGGEQTIAGIPGGPFGTGNGSDTFKINDNYMFTFGAWRYRFVKTGSLDEGAIE